MHTLVSNICICQPSFTVHFRALSKGRLTRDPPHPSIGSQAEFIKHFRHRKAHVVSNLLILAIASSIRVKIGAPQCMPREIQPQPAGSKSRPTKAINMQIVLPCFMARMNECRGHAGHSWERVCLRRHRNWWNWRFPSLQAHEFFVKFCGMNQRNDAATKNATAF